MKTQNKEHKVTVTLYVPVSVLDQADEARRSEGMDRSPWIVRAMREYLNQTDALAEGGREQAE